MIATDRRVGEVFTSSVTSRPGLASILVKIVASSTGGGGLRPTQVHIPNRPPTEAHQATPHRPATLGHNEGLLMKKIVGSLAGIIFQPIHVIRARKMIPANDPTIFFISSPSLCPSVAGRWGVAWCASVGGRFGIWTWVGRSPPPPVELATIFTRMLASPGREVTDEVKTSPTRLSVAIIPCTCALAGREPFPHTVVYPPLVV